MIVGQRVGGLPVQGFRYAVEIIEKGGQALLRNRADHALFDGVHGGLASFQAFAALCGEVGRAGAAVVGGGGPGDQASSRPLWTTFMDCPLTAAMMRAVRMTRGGKEYQRGAAARLQVSKWEIAPLGVSRRPNGDRGRSLGCPENANIPIYELSTFDSLMPGKVNRSGVRSAHGVGVHGRSHAVMVLLAPGRQTGREARDRSDRVFPQQ
ncbi:hypothetical protein [Streptomyces albospinus]|uniref:hypothetical protein n=1 Tax=Streptomyces albospinus TaxID=285515 RepID=UPI0016711F51|nr:hypothetical protein [Streptomyces albospinus]